MADATTPEPMRRTVDWVAVCAAALAAAIVTLPAYLFLVPLAADAGDPATVMRFMASLLLGVEVLDGQSLTPAIAASASLAHLLVSFAGTAFVAFVLHRWGLIVGVTGGAAMGLVLFTVNYFALTGLFEQFHAMAHWSVALVHVLFGATAGGVYELLEYDPPQTRGISQNRLASAER